MSAGKKLAFLLLFTFVIVVVFVAVNYGKQVWPIVAEWFNNLWESANA
jgi:hypothetical protein